MANKCQFTFGGIELSSAVHKGRLWFGNPNRVSWGWM